MTEISFSPHWERFIQERIENGQYTTASAVVHEALRMLEYKERVSEFRAYADAALSPENEADLVEAGPGLAEARMQRLLSGETVITEPVPWYLQPSDVQDDDEDTWIPADELEDEFLAPRQVAEPRAPYDSDAARCAKGQHSE